MASSAASSSSRPNAAPAGTPSSIGPFHIGPEIGKGSFAVVHKGIQLQDDGNHSQSHPSSHASSSSSSSSASASAKEVAIKIVTRRKLTQKLLDNLEGEIAILKAVSHPNIVELIDCLKTESHIYLVMDFSSGGDLSQYIKRKGLLAEDALSKSSSRAFLAAAKEFPHPNDGGLNAKVVRSFLEQLAAAMEFMRVRNIVHRDIKPQNLLLQPPTSSCIALGHPAGIPQMKVADFGFARSLPAASLAETLCGSPLYMAPEILRYEKYDAKADLWSIGAVTFEMTVGKPPFRAANHVELLRRIERNDDKIKFPDERSEGTWLKEVQRRRDADEYVSIEEEKRGPTKVDDDIKTLIRALLKRRPVERMSFEDFFSSPVILGARPAKVGRQRPESPQPQEILPPTSPSSSTYSSASEGLPPRATPGPTLPLQPAPSTRVQAPPPLSQAPLPKFRSKYIVAQKSEASSAVSQNDSGAPPSRTAKATGGGGGGGEEVRAAPLVRQKSSGASSVKSVTTPASSGAPSRVPSSTKLSATSERTEGGSGSGRRPSAGALQQVSASQEDDESQYVMIEKKNVEVNALADELAYSPNQARSPLATGAATAAALLVRRPSRLTRLASGYTGPTSPSAAPKTTSSPPDTVPARPPLSTTATAPSVLSSSPSAPFALPPGARRQPSFASRRTSGGAFGSPRPTITSLPSQSVPQGSEEVDQEKSDLGRAQPTSISPIGTGGAAVARYPSVSVSPGSALARAISQASQKLFGMPSGTAVLGGGLSLRGAATLMRGRMGAIQGTPAGSAALRGETSLLLYLDDYAQKAFVLCEFADSKLSSIYPEGPHQPAWASSASSSHHQTAGSMDRQRSLSLSASSTHNTASAAAVGGGNAETIANEALQIYLKSLSFLLRGIEVVRGYLEMKGTGATGGLSSSPTISPDLNEAVQSLRRRFNETCDKADFARSKCSEVSTATSESNQQAVNKLIYDKALEIGRAAALDELENNHANVNVNVNLNANVGSSPESNTPPSLSGAGQWDIQACLLAYETAAVMLSCLLSSSAEGDASGAGGGAAGEMEETTGLTVEPFFKSINHRSQALRRRIEMGVASVPSTTPTTGVAPGASAVSKENTLGMPVGVDVGAGVGRGTLLPPAGEV
ncbi:kinase-like protein [Microstroma glucosiphilum]|uniref:non-specific serine/threonine protein kinase n=1 Tax=Pseudomicrostroma glucosiphilum TaxID=1684307 RepID=A0A316U760_9BASI|nr:kinase-like protein [Pseudomicrostroma glucosiphilum]PWN18775.1 kinase-like protein [Pseudomicrostroma glucosiphilum]